MKRLILSSLMSAAVFGALEQDLGRAGHPDPGHHADREGGLDTPGRRTRSRASGTPSRTRRGSGEAGDLMAGGRGLADAGRQALQRHRRQGPRT